MHEIVTQLNNFATLMNQVNPLWYGVLVVPLTNIAIHFLKAEQNFEKSSFAKKYALPIQVVIVFVSAGFLAAFKTHTVQGWLTSTGLGTGAMGYAAFLLYRGVTAKIELYRVSQPSTEAPVATQSAAQSAQL